MTYCARISGVLFRLSIPAALIGMTAAGPAVADASLNCAAYGAKAAKQQKKKQKLGCGFKGIGWSANAQEHSNWCKLPQVTMGHLTQADRTRQNAIDQCKRDKRKLGIGAAKKKKAAERDIFCGQYAIKARDQNRENSTNKCGFKGGRWSDNVNGHRAWCLGVSRKTADAETAKRAGSLKECTATHLFSRPRVDMRKSGIHGKLPIDHCLKPDGRGPAAFNLQGE